MTTNAERAADLIYSYMSSWDDEAQAVNATQALADAGLLMPNLPEPGCHNHRDEPIWETEGATKVKTPGVLPISLTGPFNEGWDMHPIEARDIAYALLAAADYAEQEQSNA